MQGAEGRDLVAEPQSQVPAIKPAGHSGQVLVGGQQLLVLALLVIAGGAGLVITRQGPLQTNPAGSQTRAGAPYLFVADVDNWQRTDRERVVASPYNFSLSADLQQVPMTLGAWTGKDVPQTNLEVFIFLEPEQYIQRFYQLPNGQYIWLSVVGSRKSKSFHSPQICYDTDGWHTEAGSEVVPLAQGEVYALKLVANKSYPGGGRADHVVLYFYLWPSYDRNLQDGMVLVKLTAPIYGTVEDTLDLEKEFFRLLFSSARK